MSDKLNKGDQVCGEFWGEPYTGTIHKQYENSNQKLEYIVSADMTPELESKSSDLGLIVIEDSLTSAYIGSTIRPVGAKEVAEANIKEDCGFLALNAGHMERCLEWIEEQSKAQKTERELRRTEFNLRTQVEIEEAVHTMQTLNTRLDLFCKHLTVRGMASSARVADQTPFKAPNERINCSIQFADPLYKVEFEAELVIEAEPIPNIGGEFDPLNACCYRSFSRCGHKFVVRWTSQSPENKCESLFYSGRNPQTALILFVQAVATLPDELMSGKQIRPTNTEHIT